MSSRLKIISVFGVVTFTLPLACFDTLGLLINEKVSRCVWDLL